MSSDDNDWLPQPPPVWDPPPDVTGGDLPDPRTRFFNPWDRLDLGELFGRLGFPWSWPPDPTRQARWRWLLDEMTRYLEYLRRLEKDNDEEKIPGEQRRREIFLRTRMREFFGTDYRPLGPDGSVFSGTEDPPYQDWGEFRFPEEGHLKQDFAEILRRVLSSSFQHVVGMVIGKWFPDQVKSLAQKYAGALVDALEVQAQVTMDGNGLQQWKVRDRKKHLAELKRKGRQAFDLSYRLTRATDIRIIEIIDLSAWVARAAASLVNLVLETYEDPSSILDKIRKKENPLAAIQLPSLDRARRAVRDLIAGLSTIGNFGGLKRVDWKVPTPSDPAIVLSFERHVHFQAFCGPVAASNLPGPLNEVYPVAFINAALVPPWAEYFLVRLDLDYALDLKGKIKAPPDALRQALEGTARGLLDDLKDKFWEGVKSGLILNP